MPFTGFEFYIAVCCGFDKHLYTFVPKGCTARKMVLLIISQDRQTQVLATNAMATTIIIDYNS